MSPLIVHGLWSNRREKSKYFDKAINLTALSPTSKSHTQEEMAQPNNISPIPMWKIGIHQFLNRPEKSTIRAELIDYRQSDKSVDDIKILFLTRNLFMIWGIIVPEPIQPTQPQYDMPTANNVAV